MVAILAVVTVTAGLAARSRPPLPISVRASTPPSVSFAVIGDYGSNNSHEADVAAMVAAGTPDFVATVGDNAYAPNPIDTAIGKYYAAFIGNYQGTYGAGSPSNRFFPALGNHDISDVGGLPAYLAYFTLPGAGVTSLAPSGNERYYDFVRGPVHFFALDSDPSEPDGITSGSSQATWLRNGLAASPSPWNVVLLHHAPFSSSSGHGSTTALRWPFEQWGADLVLAGHDHTYERVTRDDDGNGTPLTYVVDGLGGQARYNFSATPVIGSQVRYNADYGALFVDATDTTLTARFRTVAGTTPDTFTLTAPPTGVSGTVTESGSGAPVAGAWVALLRTSDFSVAGGAVASATGDFSAAVPAGSYYLYVVDPAGAHRSGFHGAPAPVTVTVAAGAMTDADPVTTPTRGAVTGTVTDSASGTPIPGAWAVTLSGATSSPEIGAVADGSGHFTVPGLRPGNHFVGWLDPTGAHATRFHPDSPNVPDATPTAVTAGVAAVANGSLPPQTPTPGGTALSGRVVETGTNAPLAGVHVMALRAADHRMTRGAVTDAAGQYSLDVQAGSYKLAFIDVTGRHDMEWHDNEPFHGIADAASVTSPSVTDAALEANTGSMVGTITDDPAATAVAGAWVMAIGPTGVAGGAVSATNGTYTLPGLPAGTYRATFVDPSGAHTQEYWDNSPTYSGAATLNITTGATTRIDAALLHP